MAIFEAILGINFSPVKYEIVEPESKAVIIKDPVRGYRTGLNAEINKVEKQGDKVVFDVTYRTNRHGLRIAPHDRAGSSPSAAQKKIAFMGCSFTFGEGLEDNETLPYLVEERLSPHYWTYNFGFLGYGPHQMLHLIDTGFLEKLMDHQKPDLVIYSALIGHIERLAGANPYILWDVDGPKYSLTPKGEVQHVGRFKDNPWHQDQRLLVSILNRWFLLNKTKLIPRIFKSQRTPEDIELFIKVIKKTEALVKEKYQAKFLVLFWPEFQDKDYFPVVEQLINNTINVTTIDKIMEKYPDDPKKYSIDNHGHPTKLANEHVVDYLVDYILKNQSN